jgi:LysM repeat protein
MAEEEGGEGGAPAPRRSSGGNVFTRKLGPAPVWLWMAGLLGVALAFTSYRSNKAKATGATGTAASAASTAAGTAASQTPPFIIQNYTQGQGPQGPAGPAGPAGTSTSAITGSGPGFSYRVPLGPMADLQPRGPLTFSSAPRSLSATSAAGSMAAPAQAQTYRTKPGDTLASVAASYSTTPQRVLQYNAANAAGPALVAAASGPLSPNQLILIPQ